MEDYPRLYGWDDGKVYFYDKDGKERCVTDEPQLLEALIEICQGYFERKKAIQLQGESPAEDPILKLSGLGKEIWEGIDPDEYVAELRSRATGQTKGVRPIIDYPIAVTENLLQEITQKIVSRFDPEKVILFGSHAWGTPHQHSDVDLLVMMESDQPQVEREVQVLQACHVRFLPLDIMVRTPQEIAERLRIGDFFIRRILEKGRMLYELRTASGMDRES